MMLTPFLNIAIDMNEGRIGVGRNYFFDKERWNLHKCLQQASVSQCVLRLGKIGGCPTS